MRENAAERHEGHKLQLWVSDELFAVLQRQASRHNVSLAEAARQLMQAGIAPSDTMDALTEGLAKLDRFMRLHLEPLMFVAAIDSAKAAAYWKRRVFLESHQRGNPKDDAIALMNQMERDMAEQAARRVRRVLREVESPWSEDGEEGDHGNAEEGEQE